MTARVGARRVGVLRGYTAHARYFMTLSTDPIGELPREALPLPSPYSYGPTWTVWGAADGGAVVIAEVAHRRYEVWAVSHYNPPGTEDRIADARRAVAAMRVTP